MRAGSTPYFARNRLGISYLSTATIDLHDAVADDGLRQILIGSPDS
jgi:hypothetical protein